MFASFPLATLLPSRRAVNTDALLISYTNGTIGCNSLRNIIKPASNTDGYRFEAPPCIFSTGYPTSHLPLSIRRG